MNSKFAKKLQAQSLDIKGVFTRTVANLAAVNMNANARLKEIDKSIDTLKSESEEIATVVETNQRFMDKITEFLEA